MSRRLVLPEGLLLDGKHELTEDQSHYLRRVLRLKVDDELLLSDGAGQKAKGRVLSNSSILIFEVEAASPPLGPALTLIQGVGKGDKMDAVVRQATELGVRRIQPVLCERSVAHQQNRVERWRTIAEDALRVSGRTRRPVIDPVIELDQLWEQPRSAQSFCLALNTDRLLTATVESADILIGPEGGLSTQEIAASEKNGFTPVHLGAHTLRTETAGPAAIAILMYGSGGFG